ncbi:MAG TPA: helix-turn-helix domain-containing protein [Anaeromyxobacter sp.]
MTLLLTSTGKSVPSRRRCTVSKTWPWPAAAAASRESAIEAALAHENFRVARAASRLGIPRSTLYQKLKELGIDVAGSG